jgi:osmotically-inducible protein OsmY
MRTLTMVLPWLMLLCVSVGCGASNGEKSDDLTRALRTVQPVLAAEDALLIVEIRGKLAAVDVDTVGNVFVSARSGVVVLRGRARSQPQIAHLREAASSVRGVTSVTTLIHVEPRLRGASEQLRDLALETQVVADLAAQTGVNALSVHVHAVDGVVTLEGKVPSVGVRSVMWSAAAKTHGVKKIIDKLKVAVAV